MTRSSKKEPRFFVAPKLIKKVRELNEQNKKKLIRTWSRDSIIYPEMIGHIFEVHNGKIFNKVSVTSEMVGRALGEFSPTRRSGVHGKAGTH